MLILSTPPLRVRMFAVHSGRSARMWKRFGFHGDGLSFAGFVAANKDPHRPRRCTDPASSFSILEPVGHRPFDGVNGERSAAHQRVVRDVACPYRLELPSCWEPHTGPGLLRRMATATADTPERSSQVIRHQGFQGEGDLRPGT